MKRATFFQKTFLETNISIKVVLRMSFFTFSNINIGFLDRKLISKTYSATKALSIIKKVQIINRKKFAKATLDLNKKAFVVYIATITLEMTIYWDRKGQIVLLKTKRLLFLFRLNIQILPTSFLKNLPRYYWNIPRSIFMPLT